jgi:hypothetical protein
VGRASEQTKSQRVLTVCSSPVLRFLNVIASRYLFPTRAITSHGSQRAPRYRLAHSGRTGAGRSADCARHSQA